MQILVSGAVVSELLSYKVCSFYSSSCSVQVENFVLRFCFLIKSSVLSRKFCDYQSLKEQAHRL